MINPLTSLRFFFAMMVFFSHCNNVSPFFNHHIFQEGFVGVSFFFVLSGFIIAYSNKDRICRSGISCKEFWIARIARIYPLHLLTLGIALILMGSELFQPRQWLPALLPNLFLLQSFIPDSNFYYSFNSPSWSLSCELFFYFLFPFLITKAGSSRLQILLLSVLMLIILGGMFITPEDQGLVNTIWYVNPLFRMGEFLIGMLLFAFYERFGNRLKNIGTLRGSILEIVAVCLFTASFLAAESFSIVYRASVYYWIPIGFVVFVFAVQQGVLSRILSGRWLVLLGEVSFGFYMIHFLVIKITLGIVRRIPFPIPESFVFLFILSATLGLSILSFYYFEKPANRWMKSVLNNRLNTPAKKEVVEAETNS